MDRGHDLELLKRYALPKVITSKENFPFVVISPQCPPQEHWEPPRLKETLEKVLKTHHIDANRVYVTGLSMGGFGAFNFACVYPQYVAALAPVCGGGKKDLAYLLSEIPVWVFHGKRDFVVPFIRSQEMVDAIKQIGGNVKFTIYPEGEHDVWTETYNNMELYDWFLLHKKKSHLF
jgi:predicted peptidase